MKIRFVHTAKETLRSFHLQPCVKGRFEKIESNIKAMAIRYGARELPHSLERSLEIAQIVSLMHEPIGQFHIVQRQENHF